MKILFNREPNNGSTEFKNLMGFIDADINFVKLKPDVITASNDMIKLIGMPMYEAIIGIYENESMSAADEYLLYLVRYPIAVRAYMLLAPSNDIAHTPNGRKMRQDSNEKQAFEWMLDRDNIALEKRYYRALDDLLQYLDASVSGWKSSEAYKRSHKLFIRTTEEFDEHFRIDSRLILMMLQPGIAQCEQNEILPRIGRSKFDELKGKLKYNIDFDDEKDIQLVHLIKEACVYHAMSWAMMRFSVHLFPEGVLQAYTSDRMTTQGKNPALKSEPEAARQAFASDAQLAYAKIEQLLKPAEVIDTTESLIPEILSGNNFIST